MTHADGSIPSTGNAFDIPAPQPKSKSRYKKRPSDKLLDVRGYRTVQLPPRTYSNFNTPIEPSKDIRSIVEKAC